MVIRRVAVACALAVGAAGCWLVAGLGDRPLAADASTDAPAEVSTGSACTTSAECDGTECFDERCGGRSPVLVGTANRAACIVRRAGTVWCWGNPGGRVFDPLPTDDGGVTPVPRRIPVLHDVKAIAGGERYFCALEGGKVYCWGNNEAGQLGHDRALDDPQFHNATPIAVALAKPAVSIAAGFQHACAVLTDQSVWCWGMNSALQLGVEDAGGSSTATPVMALPPGSNALRVAAGMAHTCATISGGPPKCWGSNADLGLGAPLPDDAGASATPVTVPIPSGEIALAVGQGRACAQLVGMTYCWGHTAWGSADGSPAQVQAGDAFRTLSGYGAQICGLVNGALRCWGTNGNGSLYPTEVPDACAPGAVCGPTPMAVKDVVDVSAAGPSTIAVLTDGRVMGWGYNSSAVLGHWPATMGDVDCNALLPDGGSPPNQLCNPTPQPHAMLP